jgi:DNA-binding NarL/FixJ family response regulator
MSCARAGEGQSPRPLQRTPRENTAKNARIARMLNAGLSWSQIQDTLKCSRATIAKVAIRMRPEEAAA